MEASERVLSKAGYPASAVDLLVPHQANIRIIRGVGSRLGVPEDRTFVNIDKYGNTSAASIPIALDEAIAAGRINEGSLVLTVGFGAGLCWGAALIRF